MDIDVAILSRLTGAAAVTDLVGNSIAWMERIQADDYPGITLQIITEDWRQHLKGFDSLQPIDVQADVWALRHAQLRPIVDAMVAALVPEAIVDVFKFNRAFLRARDLPASDTMPRPVFRRTLDFTFNYSLVS